MICPCLKTKLQYSEKRTVNHFLFIATETFLTSKPETVDAEDHEMISFIKLKNNESTNGYKL